MQLITNIFPNKHRAIEVLQDLGDLDLNWGVPFDQAAAALTVSKHGKVRVHQSHEAAGAGAFLGGLTGFVAGMLVFAPGVGAAIGAATGGAMGATADPAPLAGVDKKFLKDFGSNLAPNTSAFIALVPAGAAAAALKAIKAYDDGVVTEAAIGASTEEAIQAAFDARTA